MFGKQRRTLLLALILAGSAAPFFLPRREEPASAPPCFATRDEAYQYALTRILAADRLDAASDPYSSTLTRSHTTVAGGTAHFFLVDAPEREFELAEGFAAHGFYREALAHYESLITFHPASPQAGPARLRLDDCRRRTVLGLVPPMTVVLRDEKGRFFVPAAAEATRTPSLDRIEEPYLEPGVPTPGPLEAAGVVDDAGGITLWLRGRPDETPNGAPVVVDEAVAVFDPNPRTFAREGAVSSTRSYYLLPDAPTLFEAERLAKTRLFQELAARLGPPLPGNAVVYRRAADAWVYLGNRDEARRIREALADPFPRNPLDRDLRALANDPRAPLHLDAVWKLQLDDHPSFKLTTKSAVTTGAEFPLAIESTGLREMTFAFAKIQGPIPATEDELKKWLPAAPTVPAYSVKEALTSGPRDVRLPVREPGAYRVTAEGRGLSCTFTVVRTDLSVEILGFPAESILTAVRGGITIASANKVLGTTGEDGLLVPSAPIRARICDDHKDCCSGCESCAHHHNDSNPIDSRPTIFVSGQGQFFRASAAFDRAAFSKVTVPTPAPFVFVHTDRPVYKAGDTIRFRGVVRIPRMPLQRDDPSRLIPAAEREVAVTLRCDETALLHRKYITGDQGTFQGEFTLPLSAFRSEYKLGVKFEGVEISRPFEVLDYRKSDYAIVLTPEAGGFRILAGYVWGAPVAGATLKCAVASKPVATKDNFVPAQEGDRVHVVLVRGTEELAEKTQVFHARVDLPPPPAAAPAEKPAAAAPSPEAPSASVPAAEAPREPKFTVKADKPLYQKGDTIEIQVEGPWSDARATVMLADVQLYDVRHIQIRNGRGTARFPARLLHDPGVAVFALCNGQQARADIRVRAARMNVAIEAPTEGRPGEQVDVTLRADPHASVALAAVDEAIYMIREDDAPEIYSFFHPERPAALVHARFEGFEYDGESFKIEKMPSDPRFKTANRVGSRLVRNAGVYEVMGVGRGGGGGGRYGGRFGGGEKLVVRGGGARASESAVMSSLRGLASLQRADGSWTSAFVGAPGTMSDVGATGLSILCFLGAGYTQLSADEFPDPDNTGRMFKFGEIVKRGLLWLMAQQAADGRLGPASGDRIFNHALATLALSEAYGMTASAPLKDPAQQAVNHLVSQQSLNGGWHASDSRKNGELLPTVFGVMALESAKLSELNFTVSAAVQALRYITETMGQDGLCGPTPDRARIAGAVVAHTFLRRERTDPAILRAVAWLTAHPPDWNERDFLGWYLSSLALFQYDGPEGPNWKTWHQPVKNVLVPNESKRGFWVSGNETFMPTALGTLTLQVYFRYANVFGGARRGSGDHNESPLVPAARVRVYFPDTVFWAPDVRTDGLGRATVSFRLPEQITATRLTARAVAKDGPAGQATARIETQQPFFLKIQAPEFAVLEDEIEIRTELYNYTGREVEAAVSLEGTPGVKTVRVPADRPVSVAWTVRAQDAAGLRLVAHARSATWADSMERRIPVHRVGRETLVTQREKSATGAGFEFDARPGVQEISVKAHPRRGNLTKVMDALRYLNSYPYG